MAQDNDTTEAHADNTPAWATGPTEVPAAGNDPDSRMRELKAQLARAEATGDDSTAGTLRKELDKVRKEHPAVQTAAASRRAAAAGDPAARTRAPQGRTATPAATTTAAGSSTATTPAAAGGTDKSAGGGTSTDKGKDK
jgi:hypothetical protein